jgi:hypothetical protein
MMNPELIRALIARIRAESPELLRTAETRFKPRGMAEPEYGGYGGKWDTGEFPGESGWEPGQYDPRAVFNEGRHDFRVAQGMNRRGAGSQYEYDDLMGDVEANPFAREIRASEPLPPPVTGNDPGLPRQTQLYLQNRMFAGPKGKLPALIAAAAMAAMQRRNEQSSAPSDATTALRMRNGY